MNCPVCNRTLAATLSICPSCGAMMNDSVREELQDKISSSSIPSKRLHMEIADDDVTTLENFSEISDTISPLEKSTRSSAAVSENSESEKVRGGMTRELRGVRHTSPILRDFPSKNNALPEWRLEMQNAVRRRRQTPSESTTAERPVLLRTTGTTNGANALKADVSPQQTPEVGAVVLENALRRVEESRKRFTVHEGVANKPISSTPKGGARTFPISLPKKQPVIPAPSPEPIPDVNFTEIAVEPVVDEVVVSAPPIIEVDEATVAVTADASAEIAEVATPVSEESHPTQVQEEFEFDEFDDIELELDEEDLEVAELEVQEVVVAKPATQKTRTPGVRELPLFPEELFEEPAVSEQNVVEETVLEENVIEEPVIEKDAAPIIPELMGVAGGVEVFEDIHKTNQPDAEESEPSYERDELSQGFIDDYDYEYRDDVEEADGEAVEEDVEDLAPISMRFNAGLLDLIIGSGVSLLLLSPFIVSGGKWLSAPGAIAFAVTLAIVMFIYMTATVGFSGRTLGMKVFSLEVIDIEENEYPDFHQAALSSSLYLVSLALGGLGFVTALFNSERRALHDLLSGTIIVREY